MVKNALITTITLVPTAFRLVVSMGKAGDAIVLSGKTRRSHGESVKLATEENFQELDGVLKLVEQEGDEPENDKPIGGMSYLKEYDYYLDVKIPNGNLRH